MIIMLALLMDLISAAENSVSQLRPTLLFSSINRRNPRGRIHHVPVASRRGNCAYLGNLSGTWIARAPIIAKGAWTGLQRFPSQGGAVVKQPPSRHSGLRLDTLTFLGLAVRSPWREALGSLAV